MLLPTFIPPVGEPIATRLRRGSPTFDWTFGGNYQPVFVDSGTTAVRLAILVAQMRLGRNGTTWIPAYGCPDIPIACLAADSEPILYDVEPDSPFFATGQRPPTDAIAAVAAHFLGLAHPRDSIRAAIHSTQAILIEDSAQRFPRPDERFFGDAVVLSFGRGKPLSLMEGGCLLLNTELFPLAKHAADAFGKGDSGLMGAIRRSVHDVAIRPWIYSLVRKLPGLRLGEVKFHEAPAPVQMGPRLVDMATRAAVGFQQEKHWIEQQNRSRAFVAARFPQLRDLATLLGQPGNRLLRVPFLANSMQTAVDMCDELVAAGIGATRMYELAQPELRGAPTTLVGNWSNARNFSRRLVTIPPVANIDSAWTRYRGMTVGRT